MKPFFMDVDFKSGSLTPNDRTNVRKLSDMKGMFLDRESRDRILKGEDPVIYSFSEKIQSEEPEHLQIALTSIYPGKIGEEYYMTKGHYHKLAHTAEAYLGLQGKGCLLMQTPEGEFASMTSSRERLPTSPLFGDTGWRTPGANPSYFSLFIRETRATTMGPLRRPDSLKCW